jgi:hypothetical protein
MSSYWDEDYSRDTSWSTWTAQAKKTIDPSADPAKDVDRTIRRPRSAALNAVFIYDVTASMQHFLENAKAKIDYFMSEVKALVPDIDVSVVGAGDHDAPKLLFQPTAFTNDEKQLKQNLSSMVFCDGDDIPEAFGEAFEKVSAWPLEGTNTVVVLLTDSVPHGTPGWKGRDSRPGESPSSALAALKAKARAFYLFSCAQSPTMRALQRQLVDDDAHFLVIRNFKRITNVAAAVLAREAGKLEEYLSRLELDRGRIRARVVRQTLGLDAGRG